MLTAAIQSLGDPGTFDISDKDDPQYYIARYAHEMSKNLYVLNTGGFSWKQEEDSDISSLISSFSTFSSEFETWTTSAVAASEGGLPIPALPSLPALPGASIPGILLSILVRLGVQLALYWLRKKLDPDTSTEELAQLLKKAFIGNNGEEDFPLMEMLGNQPLEITISKHGDYQDFLYSDRPEV